MIANMYRVEDKYACDEKMLTIIQGRLKTVLYPDKNQLDDVGYKITSVYFDDLYDTHLQDTDDGIRFREKYRIRIYNDSFRTIKLEVKYKKDSRVYKKSKNITFEQMKQLLSGQCITDESPSANNTITLFNLAIKNHGLRPKVIVEYDRTAYIYDAGNVRITLDRNLRTSTDFNGFIHNNSACYSPIAERDRVLEIKYDEFLPGFIARILENGHMNRVSFSKYRICREAVLHK